MPLPYLQKKQVAGLIIKKREADTLSPAENDGETSQDQGLESCAEHLIRAVHAKDPAGVAEAMRSAFEIMESEPHDEGAEPHSYDDQNIKAAKES